MALEVRELLIRAFIDPQLGKNEALTQATGNVSGSSDEFWKFDKRRMSEFERILKKKNER